MLGCYIEPPYTVEKRTDLPVKDGIQRIELRQLADPPAAGAPLPYIAISGKNAAGGVLDVLLLYGTREALEADWARLIHDADVPIADLQWVEKIRYHELCINRAGLVTLY